MKRMLCAVFCSLFLVGIGWGQMVPGCFPVTAFNTARGILQFGTVDPISAMTSSDDVHATWARGFIVNRTEAPIWLEFETQLTTSCSSAQFSIESSANTPGLTATVELFSFCKNRWEVVGTFSESFSIDSTFNVGVQSCNANSKGFVQARVGWRRTGFTIVPNYMVRVDQVKWTCN